MNNDSKEINIPADEINYLCDKYEIREMGILFAWGVKMLYDLSKLNEKDWKIAIIKCKIELEDTKKVTMDSNYKQLFFDIDWFNPSSEKYVRLPTPETLEDSFKINKNKN